MKYLIIALLSSASFVAGMLTAHAAEFPGQEKWDNENQTIRIGEELQPFDRIAPLEDFEEIKYEMEEHPIVQEILESGPLHHHLKTLIRNFVQERYRDSTKDEIVCILDMLVNYPADQLEPVLDFLRESALLDQFQDLWDVLALFDMLLAYTPEQLKCSAGVLRLPFLMEKIQKRSQLQIILHTFREFDLETLKVAAIVLDRHLLFEKCQDFDAVTFVLDCLDQYPADQLKTIAAALEQYRIIDCYHDSYHISLILNALREYPDEQVRPTLKFLDVHPIAARFQEPHDIKGIFNTLREYSQDQIEAVSSFLKEHCILEKCDREPRRTHRTRTGRSLPLQSQTLLLLRSLTNYSPEQIQAVSKFLDHHSILDKCQDGSQITRVLSPLREYSLEQLQSISKLLTQYRIFEKCSNEGQIVGILWSLMKYSPTQLETVLELLIQYGILDKCQDGWQIQWMLMILKDDTLGNLESILTTPDQYRLFETFQDGYQIGLFLGRQVQYPDDSFEYVLNFLRKYTAFLERFQNDDRTKMFFHIIKDYSAHQMNLIAGLLDHHPILEKCQNADQIVSIFRVLKSYSTDHLKSTLEVLGAFPILEKCQDANQVINVLQALKRESMGHLQGVLGVLEQYSIFEKYQDGNQIGEIFWVFREYPIDHLRAILAVLDQYQIFEKFQDEKQIGEAFMALKDYPIDHLKGVAKILNQYDVFKKCRDGHQVSNFFWVLATYPLEHLKNVLAALGDYLTLERYQNRDRVVFFLEHLKDYTPDQLEPSLKLLREYPLLQDCQDRRDMEEVFGILGGYSADEYEAVDALLDHYNHVTKHKNRNRISRVFGALKGYSAGQIKAVSVLLDRHSDLVGRLSDWELKNLLGTLKKYSADQVKAASEFLGDHGIVARCQNGEQIRDVLWYFTGVFQSLHWQETLKKTDLWLGQCKEIIEKIDMQRMCTLLLSVKNFDFTLLDDPMKILPESMRNLPVYLSACKIDRYRVRCQEVICRLIQNLPDERESILGCSIDFLGEQDPLTQYFLHLALEYEDAQNLNGSLAVYKEMLAKSKDIVRMQATSEKSNITLNDAFIKESRPSQPIHVPFDVWQRLFSGFKAVKEQEVFHDIYAGLEGDLDALEEASFIQDLLDPQGSLFFPKKSRVSSHSMMLREILHQTDTLFKTDPKAAMLNFSQLLVNITTCSTGKLNGIMHFYVYMNQGKVLNESVLSSEGLMQKIIHHFKEKTRRFRELIIARVVRSLTGESEPHDIYYVRGVIGHEVGLFFKDETPEFDLYARTVLSKLREKSKQQLLDLFYKLYTVDAVIDHFHIYFNHGALEATGDKARQNLVLPVITEFLREEAYDVYNDRYIPEFVELDAQGIPVGITKKAAETLLLQMGFLIRNP